MKVSRKRRKDAGQSVLIMVALSAVVLCGFAGLAIDLGVAFRAKRLVQTAADSAAIAGATALSFPTDPSGGCTGNTGTATGAVCAAALDSSSRNGFTNGSDGVTVVVNRPPANGLHTSDSKYVEAIVTAPQSTFFMRVLGQNSVSVQARAVAYPGYGTSEGCIYVLNPHASQSLYINDSATQIDVPNCAIYVNSDASDAAVAKANGTIHGKYVGIVGGTTTPTKVTQGSSNAPPTTGMVPVDDPLAWMTAPTASGSCNHATSGTIAPGYYCDGISGAAVLSPGLYMVDSGISLGSGDTLTCPTCTGGKGVTIYLMNDAGISMSGHSSMSLAAASCTLSDGTNPPLCSGSGSGSYVAYNGIVLWGHGTGGISGHGSHSNALNGVLYFPKGGITFYGNGSNPLYVAIVADSITFFGGPNLQGYPLTSGTFPITAATLAE